MFPTVPGCLGRNHDSYQELIKMFDPGEAGKLLRRLERRIPKTAAGTLGEAARNGTEAGLVKGDCASRPVGHRIQRSVHGAWAVLHDQQLQLLAKLFPGSGAVVLAVQSGTVAPQERFKSGGQLVHRAYLFRPY
jgi:hypothetical protein